MNSAGPKISLLFSQFITAPFLSKINPCHILLHIPFGSIPLFFCSHNMSYVTCPNMVFWRETSMSTSTLICLSQM